MSKKQNNSFMRTLLPIIVVIIGALIYAATGVDLIGLNTGDATQTVSAPPPSGNVETIPVGLGLGYSGDWWQLYFTTPSNSRDRSQYVNGFDVQLAADIDRVQNTLDIAAFEMNNEVITEAIANAHDRGVRVRIVTDDEHGIEDDDTTLLDLELQGIPIIPDNRSALMHNKFMIMDSAVVWTGSTNYTVNGFYRNNNNMLRVQSPDMVTVYQAEFNEMFERGQFGSRSDPSNTGNFTVAGTPIEVYFASENDVVGEIISEINGATTSIRFMTFSFTHDDVGQAVRSRAASGVSVEGVFERTGSQTTFSEMPAMFCAGLNVRQDGNSGILHHKVFIIDEQVVITGSFNFSNNAVESNDENLMIIRNSDIAQLYLQEFQRIQSLSIAPDPADMNCN